MSVLAGAATTMSDDLDLNKLLTGLRQRRTDPVTGHVRLVKEATSKSLRDSLDRSLPDSPKQAYDYLIETMEAVPDDDTARSWEESKRVEKQLDRALANAGFDVEFANQGSVTNNTHIRVHSDIDLLVCTKVFYFLEPPLKPTTPWPGNPIDHVCRLRDACVVALAAAYPAANVNDSGAKALSISGGSLRRKVDVVPGSWLHGPDYFLSGDPEHRGVKILDSKTLKWIHNYPFHHNRHIDARDLETGGNLRRLIRLFKSLRADAEIATKLSSYDIAGFCFNIPPEMLGKAFSPSQLIEPAARLALAVSQDPELRSSLRVPNGTRRVFEESREVDMMDDFAALILSALQLAKLAEKRRAA
jgi:hypothetical protein